MESSSLGARIATVRERIAAAARRAGRNPSDVTLLAVSKMAAPEMVAGAYAAGLRLFGENRVEEAGPKAAAVAALVAPAAAPAWHMIGHLQSRKADDVLPWASMVHSVDSVKLAARLSRSWAEYPPHEVRAFREGSSAAGTLPILLEVNVSGEGSKYGFTPEALVSAAEAIAALPGLRVEGLMTVAPIVPDPEEARPVFAALRRMRDALAAPAPLAGAVIPGADWRHLSMGMTDDFEVAIEEGATIVRIGRAIFG